jgi:hypothetical protein
MVNPAHRTPALAVMAALASVAAGHMVYGFDCAGGDPGLGMAARTLAGGAAENSGTVAAFAGDRTVRPGQWKTGDEVIERSVVKGDPLFSLALGFYQRFR